MASGTLFLGVVSLIEAIEIVGRPFAGFFVGPNLLVAISQREGWPGIRAGLRSLDRIVAVDGQSVESSEELVRRVRSTPEGTSVQYQVLRQGEQLTFSVPVTHYKLNDFLVAFLVPFLIGLLFLSFGTTMYFKQPTARGSMLYLALCCLIAAFCLTIFEGYTSFSFFRVSLLYPLIGAFAVHLFALFPESRNVRPKVRVVVIVAYCAAIFLTIQRQVSMADPSPSIVLSRLSSIFILLILALSTLLLIRGYFHAPSQASRDRIKVIGIGLVIASFALGAWSLNFLLANKSFYLDEGILLSSVFPIFMAYAIVRKNVFNLDRVIRLSLSYGISGAIVLGMFLVIVGIVRSQYPRAAQGAMAGWVLVFLAVVGAIIFDLVRRRLNRWIARLLFRSQFSLKSALTSLEHSLEPAKDRMEISSLLASGIRTAMGADRVGVIVVGQPASARTAARFEAWPEIPPFEKWLALFQSEGLWEHLSYRSEALEVAEFSDNKPDRFQQSVLVLKAHAVEVLVPIRGAEELAGVVLLGRKEAQERFETLELAALTAFLHRVAIVLSNASLREEVDRQARLAALGKVASILIHDIKNPLSTIKISAGSLKRRFRPGDHSHELATIIEEEVVRMNHTIAEILQYVRPIGVALERCSLTDLVREIGQTWKEAFDQAGVSLSFEVPDDDLTFSADPSRLRRAIENLLVNAKEATPSGGSVTLTAAQNGRSNGHGRISISVSDTGSGMDATTRERVFEPFFTTKSGGTGLGLAVVKQVAAEHGGEVEFESRPGVGTKFTIHLLLQSQVK